MSCIFCPLSLDGLCCRQVLLRKKYCTFQHTVTAFEIEDASAQTTVKQCWMTLCVSRCGEPILFIVIVAFFVVFLWSLSRSHPTSPFAPLSALEFVAILSSFCGFGISNVVSSTSEQKNKNKKEKKKKHCDAFCVRSNKLQASVGKESNSVSSAVSLLIWQALISLLEHCLLT